RGVISLHHLLLAQFPPSSQSAPPSVWKSQHGLRHAVTLDQPESAYTLPTTLPPANSPFSYTPALVRLISDSNPILASTPPLVSLIPSTSPAPTRTNSLARSDTGISPIHPLSLITPASTISSDSSTFLPSPPCLEDQLEPVPSISSTSPVLLGTLPPVPLITDDDPEPLPTLPAPRSASLAHPEVSTSLPSPSTFIFPPVLPSNLTDVTPPSNAAPAVETSRRPIRLSFSRITATPESVLWRGPDVATTILPVDGSTNPRELVASSRVQRTFDADSSQIPATIPLATIDDAAPGGSLTPRSSPPHMNHAPFDITSNRLTFLLTQSHASLNPLSSRTIAANAQCSLVPSSHTTQHIDFALSDIYAYRRSPRSDSLQRSNLRAPSLGIRPTTSTTPLNRGTIASSATARSIAVLANSGAVPFEGASPASSILAATSNPIATPSNAASVELPPQTSHVNTTSPLAPTSLLLASTSSTLERFDNQLRLSRPDQLEHHLSQTPVPPP
ncbi:hypothetical protein EDB84DRAFT_1570061, partial [Lactarius hengduanensis]